ncbi:sensor histidine kinase [Hymenobacter negativus]|uniref:histidine kinase n=1 Tax=Hymenobacter negativus TaxID=2795026 RepID=A0ABS0Q804_9BACT|nr:HAMP domain-containing sensor histidine kinase [Hymenobacter negativus]MBH8558808.1 HAMP domain-containing histidine kinase [Hymenobacter negativus]
MLLLLVLLALAGPGCGATRVADSLRQRLAATPPDTTRVQLLLGLCSEPELNNAAERLRFGQEGLALARRLGYEPGELGCLAALAAVALQQQDYLTASRHYQEVLRRAERRPWAARLAVQAWAGLGRVAAQEEQFAQADRFFRLALAGMRRYAATPGEIIVAQNNLAMLYAGWMRAGGAVPDSVPRLQEQYARAAMRGYQGQASKDGLATLFNIMGVVHELADRLDSALYCHRQALRLHQRSNNSYGEAQSWLSVGGIYGKKGRWAQAAPFLQTGIAQARQLQAPGIMVEGYKQLADYMAATGRGLEAFRLARLQQHLLDSLQTTEQREALARLQVQFDTERQRSRVRALSQQARLQALAARKQRQYLLLTMAVLGVTVLGLLAAGVLGWRLRRSRAQLARQNEELTATRAEQDRLYALVAHDLRSPVVAFSGLADLMTRYIERQDTARLAGLGGRVRQAAQGLRALLDNLLNWALSQRGELVPVIEPVEVEKLLAEVAALYQSGAEAAGVRLVLAPSTGGSVRADANMARTILRNLVSNALQATPAGGAIVLAAAPGPGGVEIRVTDTGQGIEPERIPQLLSGEVAPRPAGAPASTGLGLRLSVVFARVLGGRLALQSAPGQGTTAVLTLPAAVAAASPETPRAPIAATGALIPATGAGAVPTV